MQIYGRALEGSRKAHATGITSEQSHHQQRGNGRMHQAMT